MKKIAILGLHLGYGGVEQAIVNQANMFCENYEVELVITYSLMETIPYYLNPKVKVTYLTKLKPNKEVFLKYLRQKHFGKAFLEGMKSIFILYQKKKTMKSYIKKSDADILISSRITYTKLVSRYAKNKITIAEEHCHHNGNQKYIRKLQKAMKGIDYLLPVSKELTRDYQKWIQNGRTKCLFISNSLEYWPQASSSLHKKI